VKQKLARRLSGIEESATVQISDTVKRLRAQGVDVADLGGGDPDFPTPEPIVSSAAKSMAAGFTHYVSSRGIPALLDALAEKLNKENGLSVNPATDIIVTASGKHAILVAMLGLIDPGDEVLILDPAWVSYDAIVGLAGGTPVRVPLASEDGFLVTEEKIEPYVTPRSKMLMVCTPSNPTGRVLTMAESEAIARVAERHDLIVLSDEIYEKIIYDGRRHISLGTLPGMERRTLTVNGFSKTYAMTGWRLGYLAGDRDLMGGLLKVQQHTVTCATSFAQVAAIEALKATNDDVQRMVETYAERRDRIFRGLNQLPGITCVAPEGAFYAFPSVKGTGTPSSVLFARRLLEEAHVAVTPGSAFGASGEFHLRLSFANATGMIDKALERMARLLNEP
jgi:aspartate aminotransferase